MWARLVRYRRALFWAAFTILVLMVALFVQKMRHWHDDKPAPVAPRSTNPFDHVMDSTVS